MGLDKDDDVIKNGISGGTDSYITLDDLDKYFDVDNTSDNSDIDITIEGGEGSADENIDSLNEDYISAVNRNVEEDTYNNNTEIYADSNDNFIVREKYSFDSGSVKLCTDSSYITIVTIVLITSLKLYYTLT